MWLGKCLACSIDCHSSYDHCRIWHWKNIIVITTICSLNWKLFVFWPFQMRRQWDWHQAHHFYWCYLNFFPGSLSRSNTWSLPWKNPLNLLTVLLDWCREKCLAQLILTLRYWNWFEFPSCSKLWVEKTVKLTNSQFSVKQSQTKGQEVTWCVTTSSSSSVFEAGIWRGNREDCCNS